MGVTISASYTPLSKSIIGNIYTTSKASLSYSGHDNKYCLNVFDNQNKIGNPTDSCHDIMVSHSLRIKIINVEQRESFLNGKFLEVTCELLDGAVVNDTPVRCVVDKRWVINTVGSVDPHVKDIMNRVLDFSHKLAISIKRVKMPIVWYKFFTCFPKQITDYSLNKPLIWID
jgi:hypothetical protein